MTAATNREKAMSAYRQRFAHLISVRRIDSMSSCRSTSGFEDSQSSGARRGDKRMKAPATQKRGNTKTAESQNRNMTNGDARNTHESQI